MRALITGGAGFIGSHLAELLLSQGHGVLVIDDLSTGAFENIQPLTKYDTFEYEIENILQSRHLAEMIDMADIVYHLAASVGVRRIVERPVETITNNIQGTEEVLKHAAKKKKKVLIASTSEVYGKSTQLPFKEDGDLVMGATSRPRWSYACSKAIDEFLALAYGKSENLPVTLVRLFNTVGPRQTGRYGMVIPRFVQQGLAGEPITVYGDGEQTRCFTHVTDVAGALSKLMETDNSAGRVFNIGSCEEVSINTLAERIRDRTGQKSEIRHIPFSKAYDEDFEDMERRVPDLTRIQACIGYEPTKNLDQIIDDVIAYIGARNPSWQEKPSEE
ncbi:MAG: NAD-dependent epimerase/dehydratase family protein [Candidatus Sumerlaeota bacterium]